MKVLFLKGFIIYLTIGTAFALPTGILLLHSNINGNPERKVAV